MLLLMINGLVWIAVGLPPEVARVEAALDAPTLVPGESYELELKMELVGSWSASGAGIPEPLLQIDVPGCAQLEGEVIDDYRRLSKNEFLMAPYERRLEALPAKIPFLLKAAPGEDDVFVLNVIAYLHSDKHGDHFLRRRLELPVAPKAVAKEVEADKSSWEVSGMLNIGDRADRFTIKRADGSKIKLGDYLRKKNVIVTTYRAFW